MLWGLEQAGVVKISDNEVEFLFGLEPEQDVRHVLENFGVKLVFVTCGADGCVFANEKAIRHVLGLKGLHVIDTTGTGDIFGGSAVCKLLQYNKAPNELSFNELTDIVCFACTAAGLSTTKPGGISSIPEYGSVVIREETSYEIPSCN